jgi:hypothetical protein
MRKMTLFAVATAAILASAAGVWTASTSGTQASIATPGSRIATIEMMSGARNLPAEHYADHSLVF